MTRREMKRECLRIVMGAENEATALYEKVECESDAGLASSVSDFLEKLQSLKHYVITGL